MNAELLLRDLILQSKGKIFSVLFKKLDGTYRKMVCRLGVRKGLSDPFEMAQQRKPYDGRIVVWDVTNKAYRSFYVNRIAELKVRGMRFVNYGEIE